MVKRVRRAKRKIGRGRIRKTLAWKPTNVFKTKQIIDFTDISQQALVTTLGATGFALNQLDDYTAYTGLFDQYRIDKIQVRFKPYVNSQTVQPSSTYVPGILYTVIDYDDINTPASIGKLRDYRNCKETQNYRSQTRTFVPHVAAALYSGAFTSYGNKSKMWVDSASSSVIHFGIKYGITPGANAQTTLDRWHLQITYWMSFKNKYG